MIDFFYYLLIYSLILLVLLKGLTKIWKVRVWPKRKLSVVYQVFLLIFLMLGVYLYLPPRVLNTVPASEGVISSGQEKIEITFDRWIRSDSLQAVFTPAVAGEWKPTPSMLGTTLIKKLVFVPDNTFAAEEVYQIRLTNIQGLLGVNGNSYTLSFKTRALPKVAEVNPKNEQEDVVLKEPIKVWLDQKIDESVEWDFVFEPEFDYEVSQLSEGTGYQIAPLVELEQETKYLFKIYQAPVVYDRTRQVVIKRGVKTKAYEGSFTTILAPKILSAIPKGSKVLPSKSVEISFTKAMDRVSVERNLLIDPEAAGSFGWKDDQSVVFTPVFWEKGASYKVTIPAGVKDIQGGFFVQEESFGFTTLGKVKVEEYFPAPQASNVGVDTYISIKFDQIVDQASAQEKFSINPFISGKFLWKGNVMTFVPNGTLAYHQQYQIRIDAKVKSINGLDSVDEYYSVFTTRKYQVRLDVPLIHQQHSHTCNIAAARMMLAFRGVSLSEQQILQKIGMDSTPYNATAGIWGNPNLSYIGSIDGQPKGYGVHWDPIATVMREYRQATVYRNWDLGSALTEVENGNPVMLWWQNGWNDPDPISWTTPDGQVIQGVEGMHSEVIIGFVGDKNNPEEIIMNDPWRGVRHYNQEYFLRQWGYYNNTAMVVY